ncbi:MAG TPA: hypothetical protein VJB12_02135 [Candidatus Nanoarchaeia archaeon]|nr:hypothetical protein [Candidatus Nanoarchaeia archaeon]
MTDLKIKSPDDSILAIKAPSGVFAGILNGLWRNGINLDEVVFLI